MDRTARYLAAFRAWRHRAAEAVASPRGRRALTWGRRLLTVAIAAGILWQLSSVGWESIVTSLPTHPLFYVLLVFVYFSLPLFEILIYGPLWGTRPMETFLACARKRVYNEDLLGYSGEVYLYVWAAQHGIDRVHASRTVRDNNIVSSISSMSVAVALVATMVALGQLDVAAWIGGGKGVYWALGAVGLGVVIALGVVFRRHVFALPLRQALRVMAVHLTRLVVANAALVWMWSLAVPDEPLRVWLTFVTMLVVMNRLPFLPSKDLFFLGASVELSKTMRVATASLAGMLLVQSVCMKALNLLVLALAQHAQRRAPRGLDAALGLEAEASAEPARTPVEAG